MRQAPHRSYPRLRKHFVVLLAIGLTFAYMPAARAADLPVLMISPPRLTLTNAEGGQKITKQLTIRATGTGDSVVWITSELVTADGRRTIPSDRITPSAIILKSDGTPSTMTVTLDVSDSLAGEYTGELLAVYGTTKVQIPITLKVKDPFPVPILVLLLGIGLGAWLSIYRNRGWRRDQVVVRASMVRLAMDRDEKMSVPFRESIQAQLRLVQTYLEAFKQSEAELACAGAEKILEKWTLYRSDWIVIIEHAETIGRALSERAETVPAGVPLRIGIEQELGSMAQLGREAPVKATDPGPLRDIVTRLERAEAVIAQTIANIAKLAAIARNMTGADGEKARLLAVVDSLEQRLFQEAAPLDAARIGAINLGALAEIKKATGPQVQAQGVEAAAYADAPQPLPEPSVIYGEATLAAARNRIKWFLWVSYAVVLAMMALIGFAELYDRKPVFGADWITDYLALFAWGFGAEATRASIQTAVKTWSLPYGP